MDKWEKWRITLSVVGLLVVSYLLWTSLADKTSPFILLSQLVLAVAYFIAVIFNIRNKWDWALWSFITVAVLVISATLSRAYWEDLHSDQDSVSTTIRNLGLVIGGVIAILLAIWRSKVAESQAEIAQQQAATAERGLLNERYQRGAEMLGNDVLAVRMGGIYALQRLADEHPEQYHVQIMRLFCAFARNPTADNNMPIQSTTRIREDVQAIMDAIGARDERQLRLEVNAEYSLNLRRVSLGGANLNLANLQSAFLAHSILAESWLVGSDLTGANVWGANFSGAFLASANLSGTKFSSSSGGIRAYGITQSQLDQAQAEPDNPPKLEGVVDAEMCMPLVWRGRPVHDYPDEVR